MITPKQVKCSRLPSLANMLRREINHLENLVDDSKLLHSNDESEFHKQCIQFKNILHRIALDAENELYKEPDQ